MKPTLFLVIFMTITNLCLTQTSDDALALADNLMEDAYWDTTDYDYALAHNVIALNQLKNHIKNNIKYPASLAGYNISGRVEIQIALSKNGAIEKSTIIKSSSKVFDEVLLQTINTFTALDLNGSEYKGTPQFRIPISFGSN